MKNDLYLTEKELREVVELIFKKSQTDLEFRELCLTNPSQAVFVLTGKKLPAEAKLNFIE